MTDTYCHIPSYNDTLLIFILVMELKCVIKVGLASFFFALTGCSATGPLFEPAPPAPTGQALVYFYRPGAYVMGAKEALLYVDGRKFIELKNNGYTSIYLSAGHHQIAHRWTESTLPALLIGPKQTIEIPLDVQAGNTYYVRFGTGMGQRTYDSVELQWELRQVPSAIGASDIVQTRSQAHN